MEKQNFVTFIKNLLSLACIAVAVLLTASCSDDNYDNGSGGSEVVDEDATLPPTDSLKVMTKSTTYVFPQTYSRTGLALVNRVVSKATTPDTAVQTIILHDKGVSSLTDGDYQAIASLIARGGNLVYCEPTNTGIETFIGKLKTVGTAMYKAGGLEFTPDGYAACRNILLMGTGAGGYSISSEFGHDDAGRYDIFAFRGNEFYTVANTDDDAAVVYTSVSDNGVPASTDEVSTEKPENVPEEYLSGLHADDVAAWLDNPANAEARLAKGAALLSRANSSINLNELKNAQTKTYSFTAYAGHKICPVTISYEIWAVNDTQGSDYYLCNQEIYVEGSKLQCGPSDSKKWDKYKTYEAFKGLGSDISAYWAYFAGMSVQMGIEDSNGKSLPQNGVETSHVSPTNVTGEDSYTRNTTWSLGSAFTSAGTATFSGGVSFSESSTYKIPHVKLDWTKNGNSPKWVYSTPILPKSELPKVKTYSYEKDYETFKKGKKRDSNFSRYGLVQTHDEAKPIMRQDFTVGHAWLWKVNDSDGVYRLRTDFSIDLQGLWFDDDLSRHWEFTKGKYKNFTTAKTEYLSLTPPPRYEQKWIMELVTKNDSDYTKTSEYMKEYFGDYWKPSFSLYTVEKDDTMLVNMQIDSLVSNINANKPQLERAHIPTFTLIWKWKSTGREHRRYTYERN